MFFVFGEHIKKKGKVFIIYVFNNQQLSAVVTDFLHDLWNKQIFFITLSSHSDL